MSASCLLALPHGHRTLVDEADLPLVRGLTLFRGANGYVYFSKWRDGQTHQETLHRFLLKPPLEMLVDHVNGDKTDNRRSNLRAATPSLNQANRKQLNKNNTSGLRGVTHLPARSRLRPWRAQIMVDRRQLYLGSFATRDEAVAARSAAEVLHFGEFCP